jgi:carbon storage regulator
MLLIPRKRGESVIIDDDIILTVIEVRGDEVRLRIELPEGATVHRAEDSEMIVVREENWDMEGAAGRRYKG